MISIHLWKIELVKENFSHLRQLNLADSNIDNSCLVVDVLIGSNYYWSFMLTQIIKGKRGPVAMKSKVGYVIIVPL